MTLLQEKPLRNYKYLIVGDSGVGKTAILMSYAGKQFREDYMSTVGVDFKIKRLENETYSAQLNIWDTAGQQRFRNIAKSFYKGAHGIVLVYSIIDVVSYQHIKSWVEQIRTNCEREDVNIVLVGCKSDLETERKVTEEDARQTAKNYQIPFLEVSAKLGSNIDQIFLILTQIVTDNLKAQHNQVQSSKIKQFLMKKARKSQSCCR